MMKTGQILSFIIMVGSLIIGVKQAYDLNHVSKLHESQGVSVLRLAATGSKSKSTAFIYQNGKYRLVLYSLNPFSKPYVEGEPLAEDVPYEGQVEVRLVDSQGHLVHKVLAGRIGVSHFKRHNTSWTDLSEIEMIRSNSQELEVHTHVLQGDPKFSKIHSEIRLIPPQLYDMGWYSITKWMQMILSGFFLILGGLGYFFSIRRR